MYSTFLFCCFFFFKQKTAYEMRISDWSSDVCSSDLREVGPCHKPLPLASDGREGSEPADVFEAPEDEPRTAEDQGQRERIAKGPVEFGHELEIHAVDAGDRGRHGEDRRPGGELPRDPALTLLFEHAVGFDHRRCNKSEGRRGGKGGDRTGRSWGRP